MYVFLFLTLLTKLTNWQKLLSKIKLEFRSPLRKRVLVNLAICLQKLMNFIKNTCFRITATNPRTWKHSDFFEKSLLQTHFAPCWQTVANAFRTVNFQDFRENYLNSKMMLDIFCQKHENSRQRMLLRTGKTRTRMHLRPCFQKYFSKLTP